MTILHRGHKDLDYLKSKYTAISFTEKLKTAVSYGLGMNDISNADRANGYVTTVEFHGIITHAPEAGFGNIDQHIHKYRYCDAVRFRDGVIGVLKVEKLKNPVTILASDVELSE